MEITNGTVIAVDFDGTLCKSKYPECGEPIVQTVEFIRECKNLGAVIVLWTCREGDSLQTALDWCKENDVPIDYANENIPERIEQWGNDCRKISADYYIDDRAVEVDRLIIDNKRTNLKIKLEGFKC